MEIPAKLNSIPEGSRAPFRAEGEHHRSEATLAFGFRELFDFVKTNDPERSAGACPHARMGGAGQGAAVLCPASAHSDRSASSAPNRS